MKYLILACLTAITFFLPPFVTLASATDLSPAVSGLSMDFSEKFCMSIGIGITPKKAGEIAAAQLSKGLLFSPVMNEIMSTSKEDLTESLSNKIFDGCGNDLGGTQEELNDYLAQLVKKVPSKTSNSFQLTPIRQKPFT